MARVALISGGSRGIGAAICEVLAREGADVALFYRKDEEAAAAVVNAVEALGRRAKAYQADVQDLEGTGAAVGRVLDDFGGVDILVNNAGIASRGQLVVDTEPSEVQRVLAVHAVGSFHLCRLLVPQLRDRGRGDIIFISSVATQSWGAHGAPYNMGKAAVEALAKTLAHEEADNGIRVNVVAPGVVETEMGRRLIRATLNEEITQIGGRLPFGRVCQPEDVAETVGFLCSDRSQYTTGQVIYIHGNVDGGVAQLAAH
ncbi:MAG: SDR family oxidoreductase [Dehalococcoidia bacterium]|nr:SDR family oxidoreductase [Dehalococcoidia bacterium]